MKKKTLPKYQTNTLIKPTHCSFKATKLEIRAIYKLFVIDNAKSIENAIRIDWKLIKNFILKAKPAGKPWEHFHKCAQMFAWKMQKQNKELGNFIWHLMDKTGLKKTKICIQFA